MRSFRRGILALSAGATLLAGATVFAGAAGPAKPPAADDTTILHVLNRIGFGARPGDVERVRATGVTEYIDRQLHPERIPDSQITERLAGLVTVKKSSRELADEYYVPA